MGNDLTGKVALVTGGTGDIGRATALLLAEHGATVVVADIRAPEVDHDLPFYPVDVCDRTSVTTMFDAVVAAHGTPDLVLCNTGVARNAPFLDISETDWNQTLTVNLTGSFRVAQEAARHMVAAGVRGKIILTGSWVQDVPWIDGTSYCASKAGLKMLGRCMARELAQYGIRVNIVAPGILDAGLSRQVMNIDPLFRQRAERVIPLRDLQTVDQVAQAMLWACSPASDYMTGATLLIDGGCSLYNFE